MRYESINENILSKDIIDIIFENRGIKTEERNRFLNPSSENETNPFDYTNMHKAANELIENFDNNKKAILLVDSDVDGYMSSAMMLRSIRMIWPQANVVVLFHSEKQHGLTDEIMLEIFKEEDVNLVIIPDAGSENYEKHKELENNNIKCIVIDHHEVPQRSPYAIVVNNQFENEPNKNLSGAGMVYKFLQALFLIKCNDSKIANFFLDMTSTALIADIMNVNDLESRYILKTGFSNIVNPLIIQALTTNNQTKEKMTVEDIGYNISPLINSTIRIGTKEDKRNLFDAILGEERIIKDVTTKVYKTKPNIVEDLSLQEYVIFNSKSLKEKQNKHIIKELDLMNDQIKSQENYPIGVYIMSNDFPRSIGGLLANKLSTITSKPAIVLKKDLNDNQYYGSARSFDFNNLKDFMLDLNYCTFCSGHQGAFGIGFTETGLLNFRMFLETNKSIEKPELVHKVDKIYSKEYSSDFNELKKDIFKVSEYNGEWTNGFEQPLFSIELKTISPEKISLIGKTKNTVRISSNDVTFIKFKEESSKIEELIKDCYKDITIIGTFDVNEWNGRKFPQVKIVDYIVKNLEEETINPFAFII